MPTSSLPLVFVLSTLCLGCQCSREQTALSVQKEPGQEANSSLHESTATHQELETSSAPSAAQQPLPIVASKLMPSGSFYGPPRLVSQHLEDGAKNAPLKNSQLEETGFATACQKREPCRLISEQSAGTDAGDRSLHLLAVSLSEESKEPPLAGENCEEIEHWLVSLNASDQVTRAELLLSTCNDGYGASSVGSDDFDVSDNHFSHHQYGGSALRWFSGTTWQLFPRRIAAIKSGAHRSAAINRSEYSWDFRTFPAFLKLSRYRVTDRTKNGAMSSWRTGLLFLRCKHQQNTMQVPGATLGSAVALSV